MATARKTAATAPAAPTPSRRAAAAAPAGSGKKKKSGPDAAAAGGKAKAKAAKAAKPAKPEKADKADKADKTRKPKMVRDSFTIPKAEYAVLDELKQRAVRLGRPVKKSEVLRAGLKALAGMPDAAFLAGIAAVPAVKTGRPAKAA